MIANRSFVVAALTFLAVGALTAYAALQAEAVRKFRHDAEMTAISSQVVQSLRRQFVVYEQLAHALQALFRASMSVEEDEFRAFVRQIVQGRPEVIACGWVPSNPSERTDQDRTSSGVHTGPGSGYWVLLRREDAPLQGEKGVNALAELLRARDGALGLVGSVTARVTSFGTRTALCYCGTAQSRGGVLVEPQRGRIAVIVDLEESVRQVLKAPPRQAVEIRLELGDVVVRAGSASDDSEWHVTPLPVAGALARLRVASRPRTTAAPSEGLWLWGFGIACSLLASASVYLIASQHERTRILVEQRTRELQEANRRLQGEIEHRLQVEDALRHAHRRAEEAAAAKSEFISRVSHEIRTPVQTICSVVDLLQRTDPSRADQGHIRLLQSASEALLDLVDNVLNFARIETGRIEVQPAVVPLREQLADWVKLFAVRARERGLELLLDVDPTVPALAEVDATLFRQVVVNLVSNAVKYTDQGYVRVWARGSGVEGRDEVIEVVVEDSGPGVSQEERDEMFKPFVRFPRKQGRQEPGTGLGLAIVRRSVEAVGGSISVEPVSPHGTRFTVRFPCKHLACSLYAVRPPWRPKVQRVWLCCQSERWRELLVRWFELWGCPTTVGEDDPGSWDVVVLEFSGEPSWGEASSVSLISGGKPVVVLADALSARPSPRTRLRQVAWLRKPVSPDELSIAVNSLLCPALEREQEEPDRRGMGPVRILLVEDTEANRVLLETTLRRNGHQVRVAGCLSEALDLVKDEQFDVVLLDIELPDGNGFELARRLRHLEQQEPRPRAVIIAISGHTGAEHQRRCAEAGVDVCLRKPIHPDRIATAISKALGSGASMEREKTADGAERTPTLARVHQVDLAAASRNVGGDWQLYKRVLAACAGEVPGLVEAVERALREGHTSDLRRALHTLRGALRTVGATGLVDELRIAEGVAAKEDLNNLAAVWGRVRPKVDQFLRNDVPALQSLTEKELDRLTRSDKTLRTAFRPASQDT